MKTTFTSLLLVALLSTTALGLVDKFSTPLLSYRPPIDKSQEESTSTLLKYMNNDLTFIEGGYAYLPNSVKVQRFGGSATQTSHFIGLLKSAGLWEIQVRFRDFGEQESAFTMIDHSPVLKTVEVNSGRQDFLLKHFAEHLPQSKSGVDAQPTLQTEAEQGAAEQPAIARETK